ncbi:MAG: glycerol-3-phosphate dehydrogenase [Kiritimatiellia bacterium]|jgi:glycerol-3-phosphate dehydrogenase
MQRDLTRLADETFDVLIIGGGVNGLATAYDAAQRGLRVALVEKGDFGGETSAASLKIIHGGLRYLQHLDFRRMRESIFERRAMMRMAPHLIDPFPFLVPTYGSGMKGKSAMSLAMGLNDIISYDRNRGTADEKQHLPRGQIIAPDEVVRYAPCVPKDGLTGGAIFYDGRMYHAERVTLALGVTAAEHGACLANYVAATGLIKGQDQVLGARVQDQVSGDTFDIRASVTVCAVGPWLPALLAEQPADERYSAGIQIITRAVTTEGMGLAVPGTQVDPDSKIKRGGRHYFTTPWRGQTIWGTTDEVYEGDPGAWQVTDAMVRTFLGDLNETLPGIHLKPDDVVHAFGGLRPVEPEKGSRASQVSRKYEIADHAEDLKLENLISIVGIKYTVCRLMAEKITDLVFKKLGRSSPTCKTAMTPLIGGDFSTRAQLRADLKQTAPEGISPLVIQHLMRMYGTRATRVLDRVKANPTEGELVPGSDEVIVAELRYAIEEECALTADDLILRRTDLGTLGEVREETRIFCEQLLNT